MSPNSCVSVGEKSLNAPLGTGTQSLGLFAFRGVMQVDDCSFATVTASRGCGDLSRAKPKRVEPQGLRSNRGLGASMARNAASLSVLNASDAFSATVRGSLLKRGTHLACLRVC